VGFVNHDKFMALSANAICLWLEGKNYCDENHTDGMLPTYIVKRFRFYSKRSIELLTTPCGIKPGTSMPYASLWEPHAIGWKMHDYLDHNECREIVLSRIQIGENAKKADRDRKAKARAVKAHKAGLSTGHPTGHTSDIRPDSPRTHGNVRPVSDSNQNTEYRSSPKERERHPAAGRDTGRIYLHRWQIDDLIATLGPHADAFALDEWIDGLTAKLNTQGLVLTKDQRWPWVQAELTKEIQIRRLPVASVSTPDTDWKVGAVPSKRPHEIAK